MKSFSRKSGASRSRFENVGFRPHQVKTDTNKISAKGS